MDYEWILNDDIRIREDGGGVVVEEATPDKAGGYRSVRLTYHAEPGADHGVLRFNNCYVDVGDDFPRFLGIMDAAAEGVTFIGDSALWKVNDPEYSERDVASWMSELRRERES